MSGEEARGLLAGATLLAPFRVGDALDGSALPSIVGGNRQQHVVAWGAYAPVAPLFAAATDLAATVIALSEQRDEARAELAAAIDREERLRSLLTTARQWPSHLWPSELMWQIDEALTTPGDSDV